MATTYTDVQGLSSDFAALSQSRIDPFIARAQGRMNEAFWGDLYDEGVLYLAAHLLAQAERNADAAGAVTSKKAGPFSVSYQAPAGVPGRYASTQWGVEYWNLIQTLKFKASRAI